jgi:hypothetical protein
MRRHTHTPRIRGFRLPVAALVALGLLAATFMMPAAAQAQERRDYLLGAPAMTLTLRGGFAFLRGDSEIYEFVSEHLTLERSDFRPVELGADFAIRLSDRFDLVPGIGYSRTARWSEYRDYVEDVNGQERPIEQQTTLARVPLTLSVRAYPLARGRTIGRFVYIPARVVPYVGAGAGTMWHSFAQDGDFVDVDDPDLAIFTRRFESDGFGPVAQVFAGVEYGLGNRFALTVEARYHWASARMGRDFDAGFDRIDLSGLQTTAGLQIRF